MLGKMQIEDDDARFSAGTGRAQAVHEVDGFLAIPKNVQKVRLIMLV
jgi:hypothetical protein